MEAGNDTTYPAKKTRVPRGIRCHGANEDLPIDQIPFMNETEDIVDCVSTELERRTSQVQTSVKRDSEHNMPPEFAATVIQGPTTVAAMGNAEASVKATATRIRQLYTTGDEAKEEGEIE
jgi:hypothetical protein